MAVLHVDEAAGDAPAQRFFDGQSHGRAGLARADHVDVAVAVQAVTLFSHAQRVSSGVEMAQHRLDRIGRFQGRTENGQSMFSLHN